MAQRNYPYNHRVYPLSTPRRRLPPSIMRPRARGSQSRLPKIVARILIALIFTMALLVIGGIGTMYGIYAQLASSLTPRLDEISNVDSFQTTRIYDRNNVLLYEFFGAGKRTRVAYDQIATNLISATIAIEDKTFFENQGVDYEGLAKALIRSISAGEETGGASTITQQLIREVVLTDEERVYNNRYQRKLTEIVLAQELTERYSKKEILELYLNEIYYGNLAYGIEAAANTYFGIHAKDLKLPQAALLSGLPQYPRGYDPINYLEGGILKGVQLSSDWLKPGYQLPESIPPPKWRQIAVIRQMIDEGYITAQVARNAI